MGFLISIDKSLKDICHIISLRNLLYLQRQSSRLCLLKFKGLVNSMEVRKH